MIWTKDGRSITVTLVHKTPKGAAVGAMPTRGMWYAMADGDGPRRVVGQGWERSDAVRNCARGLRKQGWSEVK